MSGIIAFPNGAPALNSSTVVRLDYTDTLYPADLNQALIVWDVEGEAQPAFGRTFTVKPRPTIGETLVEAEAVLPDGRRIFGRQYLNVNDAVNGGIEFQNPPADTAVALYHFNGNLLDSSGNHYDFAWSGLVTPGPNAAWMRGIPTGQSAKFGGGGDRLQATIPDAALRPHADGFTLEARIYVKRYVPNTYPFVLSLAQPDAQGNPSNAVNWSLYFDTPTAPQFYGPQGQRLIDAAHWSASVTTNTWHSLKVTVNGAGTTTMIYIDSQLFGPFTTNPSFVNGGNWILTMGDFVGDFDEIRISNTIR